ncbi:uncharacterized protein G2W53_002739 [Senna tora]|uniref:Uncharacterized protein n=1 Tax=Senna tora TaxID=362788 RepID=A0A834X8M1_9FABA|nr:uncharacterized protein G2W53_002739 [Senna tora]
MAHRGISIPKKMAIDENMDIWLLCGLHHMDGGKGDEFGSGSFCGVDRTRLFKLLLIINDRPSGGGALLRWVQASGHGP